MILLRIDDLAEGQTFMTTLTNRMGKIVGRQGGGTGTPVILWDENGREERKSICGRVLVRPA